MGVELEQKRIDVDQGEFPDLMLDAVKAELVHALVFIQYKTMVPSCNSMFHVLFTTMRHNLFSG